MAYAPDGSIILTRCSSRHTYLVCLEQGNVLVLCVKYFLVTNLSFCQLLVSQSSKFSINNVSLIIKGFHYQFYVIMYIKRCCKVVYDWYLQHCSP